MDMSYVFWQTSPWLMFLAVCAALYFSLTWPEVKGKWWLVASLSILVFVESFSYVLQNYIGQSNKILMGPNEYQKLWSFSILLTVWNGSSNNRPNSRTVIPFLIRSFLSQESNRV